MTKYAPYSIQESEKYHGYPRSKLEARIGIVYLEILLRGPTSPRTRRTILLTVLRQITRVLGHLPESTITSSEVIDWVLASWDRKEVTLHQAPGITSACEKEGLSLRLRRNQAGLTQAQLAAQLGVSRSYLSELERGHYEMGPRLRSKLGEIFKVRGFS